MLQRGNGPPFGEDCSDNGEAWSHFPHAHARFRTFRWTEDGISAVSDTHGSQNIAFSFWNEKEYAQKVIPLSSGLLVGEFLKKRLFSLFNSQGNHGESIIEAHFHLDDTPTVRSTTGREMSIV